MSAAAAVVGVGLAVRPAFEADSLPAAVIDAPTGTILFAGLEPSGGNSDIFMAPPDGSSVTRLTTYPGPDYSPSWSPDKSQIVFVSDREDAGNPDIYVMDSDGSNVRRITHSEAIDGGPAWAPDGAIAFWRSHTDGKFEALTVSNPGAMEREVPGTKQNDAMFAWSPDGARLAVTRNQHGDVGVVVINTATGETQEEYFPSTGASSPTWSPDGSALAFSSDDGTLRVVQNGGDTLRLELPRNVGSVGSVEWGPTEDFIAIEDQSPPTIDDPQPQHNTVIILNVKTMVAADTIAVPEGFRLVGGISWA